MDHEQLLRKYINHVRAAEDSDSIWPQDERGLTDAEFTDEEWAELTRISRESQE